MSINLEEINIKLRTATPNTIVQWAINHFNQPIITTNFRPYEAAILHAVTQVKKDIKVIWCDTGYNTLNTYHHAEALIKQLHLNINLYIPKQTKAYREAVMGIPQIEDPEHKLFTEQVKLEPFNRAIAEHSPEVWFTNLRKGQTAFRDGINIVSKEKNGIIKVCPFYYWTDQQIDQYLIKNNLPNEFDYFDPTKQLENRECGLHT